MKLSKVPLMAISAGVGVLVGSAGLLLPDAQPMGMYAAAGLLVGWLARGAFSDAVVSIGIRILASKAGKAKVLAALAEGVAKLDAESR